MNEISDDTPVESKANISSHAQTLIVILLTLLVALFIYTAQSFNKRLNNLEASIVTVDRLFQNQLERERSLSQSNADLKTQTSLLTAIAAQQSYVETAKPDSKQDAANKLTDLTKKAIAYEMISISRSDLNSKCERRINDGISVVVNQKACNEELSNQIAFFKNIPEATDYRNALIDLAKVSSGS